MAHNERDAIESFDLYRFHRRTTILEKMIDFDVIFIYNYLLTKKIEKVTRGIH